MNWAACSFPLSVVVAMMKVQHMRVAMNHPLVPVPMSMRFSGWIGLQVFVLMVPIVTVRMLVFQRFVKMFVLVVLGQMHPHPEYHKHERRPKKERRRFVKQKQREHDADKGRGRKVGTRSRRTQIAQS